MEQLAWFVFVWLPALALGAFLMRFIESYLD